MKTLALAAALALSASLAQAAPPPQAPPAPAAAPDDSKCLPEAAPPDVLRWPVTRVKNVDGVLDTGEPTSIVVLLVQMEGKSVAVGITADGRVGLIDLNPFSESGGIWFNEALFDIGKRAVRSKPQPGCSWKYHEEAAGVEGKT